MPETQNSEENWKIDGKEFSIGELLEEIVERALNIDQADEVRFNFSGDYASLKKYIERCSSDIGTRYIVSKGADVSNEGNKLNVAYNVIIRRRKYKNARRN